MIGRLNEQITFQAPTLTDDGIGGKLRAWANFTTNPTVWAEVTARIGREAMVEGRMTAVNPTTFTVFYRSDVNETHRILWNGEAYQIRNVMRSSGRKLYLQIDAERGAAQ